MPGFGPRYALGGRLPFCLTFFQPELFVSFKYSKGPSLTATSTYGTYFVFFNFSRILLGTIYPLVV